MCGTKFANAIAHNASIPMKSLSASPRFLTLLLAGTTLFWSPPQGQAQLYKDFGRQGATSRPESARTQFVGSFRNKRTGDTYRFQANGSYTFEAGPAKRRSGNVSHSGTWRILDYYEGSSDDSSNMGTLQLRATRRVVLEKRKRRTLRTVRTFQLPMALSMEDGVIFISEQRFDALS